MSEVTAEQIITVLYKDGYFERGAFNPFEFEGITHKGVGLGMTRALDVLAKRDMTKFEYCPDENIHPKDMIDSWRIILTEEGEKFVAHLK